MSSLCCLCGARSGRFCNLCSHHLCVECSTHWAERGQAAFKEMLGMTGHLKCDHPKGEPGGADPEV